MRQRYSFLFVIVLFNCLAATPLFAANQLQNHSSPYLAMHGNDPVEWREWSEKTFQEARQQEKLLYVSVGYFSCHWCHVMHRESYKNQQIAQLINQYFIPVKIDRELRPALDARLISFVEKTHGRAGWPLNVFITPDGFPLTGLTYLPPQAFTNWLNNVQDRWKIDRKELEKLAVQAHQELLHIAPISTYQVLDDKSLRTKLLRETFLYADELSGGFGSSQKFPMASQLSALLSVYQSQSDDRLREFLVLTLEQMASQGLNDQIGGGFYRYAVDPSWQVPHFEKMLYTNALLADLYLQAAEVFNLPQFEQIAVDTLEFMLREMRSPHGGFISSFSAVDGQGREGGFYLFDEEELKKVLNADELRLVGQAWSWPQPQDSEKTGGLPVQVMSLAQLANTMGKTESELKVTLGSAQKKLLQHRNQFRHNPPDDKVLSGWNGLVLRAFSHAAVYFNKSEYKTVAKQLHHYLLSRFWKEGALLRASSGAGQASLEDYAYVSSGMLAYYQLSHQKEDLRTIMAITTSAWSRFYYDGGWRLAESSLLSGLDHRAVFADNALPSPSARLIESTLRLVALSDSKQPSMSQLSVLANKALAGASGELSQGLFWNISTVMLAMQEGVKQKIIE